MSMTKAINSHLATSRHTRKGPGAIFAVALDGDQAVCMSETTLDAWWQSLTPEEKGEVWERELDRPADLAAAADLLEQSFIDILRSPLKILEVTH